MIFLPNFGVEIGGAQRWLKIGNISFQPSEFLKVTFFLYLASFLTSNFREKKSKIFIKETKESWKKFISFLLILAVIAILLILQPDISTLGIIIFIALLMYFLGKAPIWHILVFLIIIGVLFSGLIKIAPYRIERILVFLNPEMDPLGAGYQIKQSLIAIGSGGVWGRGLGLSQQKLGFLPQSLSDSIFSIFAEETGFIGAIFLVFLFLFLFWRSLRIAKSAPDSFSQLLALGLGSHLIFQAFVNISALIGILPLTGIPLPFISYGGSALVTNLTEIGLLLNISKQAKI
jgi:cell division protein FtsW